MDKPHYKGSDAIFQNSVPLCRKTGEELERMPFERRVQEDLRIAVPGWGMVNFWFDQNSLLPGSVVNDTDPWTLDVIEDDRVVATRRIANNGSWFKTER